MEEIFEPLPESLPDDLLAPPEFLVELLSEAVEEFFAPFLSREPALSPLDDCEFEAVVFEEESFDESLLEEIFELLPESLLEDLLETLDEEPPELFVELPSEAVCVDLSELFEPLEDLELLEAVVELPLVDFEPFDESLEDFEPFGLWEVLVEVFEPFEELLAVLLDEPLFEELESPEESWLELLDEAFDPLEDLFATLPEVLVLLGDLLDEEEPVDDLEPFELLVAAFAEEFVEELFDPELFDDELLEDLLEFELEEAFCDPEFELWEELFDEPLDELWDDEPDELPDECELELFEPFEELRGDELLDELLDELREDPPLDD